LGRVADMTNVRAKLTVLAIATAIAVAGYVPIVARVDVKVESDKTFDFKPVRTWAWNPKGRGDVKMARTQDDDPEAMRGRAEPIIVDAVTAELTKRGLAAASGEPDLFVTYYLLLTVSTSAQTMGQFLPATTGWGLPPFAPATQSMKIMNRGSLVIDLSAKDTVVWRGVAQANIKLDADAKQREALLRESVRDLLRRYPP
jgi:hypothetical protein